MQVHGLTIEGHGHNNYDCTVCTSGTRTDWTRQSSIIVDIGQKGEEGGGPEKEPGTGRSGSGEGRNCCPARGHCRLSSPLIVTRLGG